MDNGMGCTQQLQVSVLTACHNYVLQSLPFDTVHENCIFTSPKNKTKEAAGSHYDSWNTSQCFLQPVQVIVTVVN